MHAQARREGNVPYIHLGGGASFVSVGTGDIYPRASTMTGNRYKACTGMWLQSK